jgi:hypothetical protein
MPVTIVSFSCSECSVAARTAVRQCGSTIGWWPPILSPPRWLGGGAGVRIAELRPHPRAGMLTVNICIKVRL